MAITATQFTLLCVIGIVLLARPAHAFGAGNIGSTSKIEGENWRHGDLEDTFLTLVASRAMGGKKFSKLDVKRIYFGNWLRDYSQAVDVGTVKNISAEAIRVVLWILGFMSFGYGTKEFEVTTERLGCYRPEEHIDNPKDYADNEDARNYDRRLRAPVDEERELAIDPQLGLKAYIASENLGIDTSAGLVRKLFGRSIELGRRYARNKNKADLYEALRLLGTGCHCLEDFSAHSNYTELALIELGEREIFPHVGRNCKVRLRGARSAVYPLVTGTFGGVDFLHSVTGEFDDKVTQSEIQELEGTLQQAQQNENSSVLQELLHGLPDGIFGGKDEAGKADELKTNATEHAMSNVQVSPREPEEWLQYIKDAQKQIYPIIEWHDEVMQSITETIEKIPILPDVIEKVQEEVNVFVFSLLAPFMLPIIQQIKAELNTGSSAIIQSSVDKQHIVFSDDDCSDPTHSMLSKDHFSNVLNEPAGKIAGQVLRWVVPQLISAWDDENIDINRTLNRIIQGVFHHPALRQVGEDGSEDGRAAMFGIVQNWWESKSEREKDGLRDQLSRDGVEEGRNHKPGVHDHGHGSAKKLGMPNVYTANHQGAPGGFGGPSAGAAHTEAISQFGQSVGDAVGGGVLGSIVGGLTSAVGTGVVAGAFGGDESGNTQTYSNTSYGNDGSRTQRVSQYSGNRTSGNYGETQYSRTEDQSGNRTSGYSSYQQQQSGNTYSSQTRHEERSSYGETTSSTYTRREETGGGYGSSGYEGGRSSGYGQQASGGYGSQQTPSYGQQRRESNERPSYGRRNNDDETPSYGRRNDSNERQSHNRRNESNERQSHGRRNDSNERPSYGRRNNDSDEERSNQGRRQESSGYNQGGYGQQESYNSGGYGSNQRSAGFGSNQGYGQQTSSYGRTGGSEYENRQESNYGSGGYGRSEGREEYGSSGNYGGNRRRNDDDDSERMPGGFGGDEDEGQRRSYGQRRNDNNEDEGGYGGRRYGGYGN